MRRHFRRLYILYFGCLVTFVIILIYEANYGFFCSEKDLSPELSSLKHLQDQIKFETIKLNNLKKEIRKLKDDDFKNQKNLPWIYIITPTYTRAVQKAELTRLSHTFLHVKNLHWIIIEDAANKSLLVTNFLKNCGLHNTHLNVATPPDYKLKHRDPNWLKPRGVLQRNKGLEWIRTRLSKTRNNGVLYFGDDDNTYDLKLFEEMRSTKKVSVWPVGLVGKLRYEAPLVHNGKVIAWHTYWKATRPFAIDMAGFAINLYLLFDHPDVTFQLEVPRGYQESILLKGLVAMDELEPKADNCSKVLVWHTRTEMADLRNEQKLLKHGKTSDPRIEV